MEHYLTTLKGSQPTRMGEEEMDKLTRMYAYYLRKGDAKNFSQSHRLVINTQYNQIKRYLNNEEKSLTYKGWKHGTTTSK